MPPVSRLAPLSPLSVLPQYDRGDDVLDIDKRVETFDPPTDLRAGEGKIDRGDIIHIAA